MNLVVHWITTVFDLFTISFQAMRPIVGLCVISGLAGCVLMKLFYWTMNKESSERAKNKIKAHLLEMVLYQHDITLSLRALRKIIVANLIYLKTTLIPLVVILIPCIIIMGQLYTRYASKSFSKGDEFVVKSFVSDTRYLYDISLDLSKGLQLDAPALRIQERGEINWRIKAIAGGAQSVNVILPDGKTYSHAVYIERTESKLPPGRYKSWVQNFLFPGAETIEKNSPIKAITIQYPSATHNFFGWHTSWLVIFCIVSIVVGFGLKIVWG